MAGLLASIDRASGSRMRQSSQIGYCCARRSLKSVSGSLNPSARTFFRMVSTWRFRCTEDPTEHVVVELFGDLHDLRDPRGPCRSARSDGPPVVRSETAHPAARFDTVEDASVMPASLEEQRPTRLGLIAPVE